MRLAISPLLLSTLLALAGCSTLSEKQCQTSSWSELGERDAYNGYGRDRLYDHRKACAEHGVTADAAAYEAGWDNGIKLYCTPHRGYEVGKTGATYRRTCPPAVESSFLRGYEYGRALYQEQKRVADLQRDIRAYEDKLRKASDADGRESLRRRIRDLDDELASVRRQMRRLQEDAAANGFF